MNCEGFCGQFLLVIALIEGISVIHGHLNFYVRFFAIIANAE